jgi:uncharacterized membrane protein (UPF0182 family)
VQILPFTPSNRKNMIGWMAGRSDAQGQGTLLSYDFPKDKQVTGPEQFRARINQDSYLSGQITLWNQQGSTVLRGNLLVIPLGQGLLYAEPIFLQATQSGIPELRLVVLGTQERIAYGTNFRAALTKLLSGDDSPPADAVGQGVNPSGSTQTPVSTQPATDTQQPAGTTPTTPGATGTGSTGAPANRQQLINRAADDLEAYQRLTSQGRYSEAGQRLESVRSTLEQLRRQDSNTRKTTRNMKLLILGGTLFLGRHLTEAAQTRGHEVTLLIGAGPTPDCSPTSKPCTAIGNKVLNLCADASGTP